MQGEDGTGKVLTVSADVSDLTAVRAVLTKVEKSSGPVDVAVCCAGLATPKSFVDQEVAEAATMMSVRSRASACF